MRDQLTKVGNPLALVEAYMAVNEIYLASECFSYINHGHRMREGGRKAQVVRMGNSLRCCLACVLPCGALDVVRVVHLSGHVEEYSRRVSAGEILAANPNHVLTRPCSRGVGRRILIVPPESELKRGRIYFLMPAPTLPEQKRRRHAMVRTRGGDEYTTEIESGKKPIHRRRRSGRVGVHRWQLESICEDS